MEQLDIRGIKPEDYEAVAELIAKGYSAERDRDFFLERFRYWWNVNPNMNEKTDKGWVVLDQKKIVGFYANICCSYLINGREEMAASASQAFVDTEYRGRNLYQKLVEKYLAQESPCLFITNTPNALARHVISRMGSKLLKKTFNMFEMYYILRPLKFFRDFFLNKISNKNVLVQILMAILLIFLVPCFLIIQKFLFAFCYSFKKIFKNEIICEIKESFDSDLEAIWNKCKTQWKTTVNRTPGTMHWLYFNYYKEPIRLRQNPERYVIVAKKKESPEGFLVFQVNRERTMIKIVDVICDVKDAKVYRAMVIDVVRRAKKLRLTYVLVPPYNSNDIKKSISLGPFIFKGYPNYFYIFAGRVKTPTLLSGWYPTGIDPDAGVLN